MYIVSKCLEDLGGEEELLFDRNKAEPEPGGVDLVPAQPGERKRRFS